MSNTNVKIGNYDCFETWGYTLTTYSVDAPEVETVTVSVPGRNGVIDITNNLFGGPKYKNRTISMEFAKPRSEYTFDDYRDILEKVHGKMLDIIFDQEPNWKYTGRCTVSALDRNAGFSSFTIEVDADPFKTNLADETIKSL